MEIDFESYIRSSEPSKQAKASAWKTAIGLQSVVVGDGGISAENLLTTNLNTLFLEKQQYSPADNTDKRM